MEVNLDQEINIESLNVNSKDGVAEVIVGGIVAHGDSEIEADVKSEINVRSINVNTNDGHASALIGAVVAGR